MPVRNRAACSGFTANTRVAGRGQRRHPRATVSLDPDHHLGAVGVIAEEPANQAVQLAHPGHDLRHHLNRSGGDQPADLLASCLPVVPGRLQAWNLGDR